jgi:hypothetical protein
MPRLYGAVYVYIYRRTSIYIWQLLLHVYAHACIHMCCIILVCLHDRHWHTYITYYVHMYYSTSIYTYGQAGSPTSSATSQWLTNMYRVAPCQLPRQSGPWSCIYMHPSMIIDVNVRTYIVCMLLRSSMYVHIWDDTLTHVQQIPSQFVSHTNESRQRTEIWEISGCHQFCLQ